jgi:hypothetical protein
MRRVSWWVGGGGSSRGEVKDAPTGKERTKQKRAFTLLLLPSLPDVPPSLASVELMMLLMSTCSFLLQFLPDVLRNEERVINLVYRECNQHKTIFLKIK